ncbi:MAG: YIP1 family protein [Gemmatimonadota bacterium]|nr:YIP1 family protein [Gemmatimonadota bacterium]
MAICSHCGYEAPSFATCPLCGGTGPADAGPGGVDAPGAIAPAWERDGTAFPRNLIDTWVESLFRPDRFFRGVSWDEAAARPILYYLIIAIIGAIFSLWWSAAFTAIGFPLGFQDPDPLLALSPAASALINFFAAPFVAIIGLVLWSGLVHLLVIVFGRDRRGFRATMRAVCYGAGPSIFAVVPVLGAIVGFFWTLALTGIGLRHAHRMTTGAAVAVILLALMIPLALLFGLMVIVFASVAAIA